MESTVQSNLFDLQVDNAAMVYLRDAARWAKFLAVAGFIFCGLFVVVAVLFVSLLSSLFNSVGASGTYGIGAVPIAFVYIFIAVLNFFPCLYLYNFATRMHAALRSNDQEQLNTSFRNMRAFYRFVGVMMIIALGFFLLGILGMVLLTAAKPM
jgi:Family of unknown function (DUF5362)